jgi:hypothetical protein
VKERTEAPHLDFASDEIEPRLQLRALERAVERCELLSGGLFGDVLDDRRSFGEDSAVIELKGRYEA